MSTETYQEELLAQALAAADEIESKPISVVFNEGPRKQFIEYTDPKVGIYRLHIARPFGVRPQAGMNWRIHLTVQFEGRTDLVTLNDGRVQSPYNDLGDVVIDAAGMLAEHIAAHKQVAAETMRQAIKLVAAPQTACTPE